MLRGHPESQERAGLVAGTSNLYRWHPYRQLGIQPMSVLVASNPGRLVMTENLVLVRQRENAQERHLLRVEHRLLVLDRTDQPLQEAH